MQRVDAVPDPGDGIYPFDRLSKTHAVILLDNDPLTDPENDVGIFGRPQGGFGWTCVISTRHLTEETA